jgi:hypothetical protein
MENEPLARHTQAKLARLADERGRDAETLARAWISICATRQPRV